MATSKTEDIILNSKELKKMIIRRSEEFGIHLSYVAQEVGIPWRNLRISYLNSVDESTTPAFSHGDLIKMADILGIDVKVRLIIRDQSYDGEKMKEYLLKRWHTK